MASQPQFLSLQLSRFLRHLCCVVEPWDKTALKSIEKAIETSDLGITPSNDGSAIRLPFPMPTEERRRELAKECSQIAEELA